MRIYLSGLRLYDVLYANQYYAPFFPNILIAYNLDKTKNNNDAVELINNQQEFNSLMIDSGAFVANAGRLTNSKDFYPEESFKDLCHFYNDFSNKINLYFNYDILFKGDNSFPVNKMYFERMRDIGLDPIFVMHSFEQEEIDYILNLNPVYVSIASANLKGVEQINEALRVTELFYNSGIKVHLLGSASYKILSRSKAWSCDASSYVQWLRAGRLIYFSSISNEEISFTLNEFDKRGNYNKDYLYDDSMINYKNEYTDFIKNISEIQLCELEADHNLSRYANAYYMLYLEKLITDIQKQNGVDFTQDKFRNKDQNNIGDW